MQSFMSIDTMVIELREFKEKMKWKNNMDFILDEGGRLVQDLAYCLVLTFIML